MEQTKLNLLRINDILTEIEGNIEPLKAQSEKAKKYLNLREELKNIEVGLFVYNINSYIEKLDSKQHKETPEEELKRLRKRVKQLEGKEVKNTNTIKGLRKELKKKDVQKITMTNEQRALLSHLFPDIDSLL